MVPAKGFIDSRSPLWTGRDLALGAKVKQNGCLLDPQRPAYVMFTYCFSSLAIQGLNASEETYFSQRPKEIKQL